MLGWALVGVDACTLWDAGKDALLGKAACYVAIGADSTWQDVRMLTARVGWWCRSGLVCSSRRP